MDTWSRYGIFGQKLGIRRYQNRDGTLTPEGKHRYSNVNKAVKDIQRDKNSEDLYKKVNAYISKQKMETEKDLNRVYKKSYGYNC